jgi:hypothetical protein
MQRQFNLKLDTNTAIALKRLALATQRSQAGVVRWLILAEATRLPAQPAASMKENMEAKAM